MGLAVSARSNATGNAGYLIVQADTIKLTNQGKISTEAENAAGGNIIIRTPNLLYFHDARITTSVGAGKGKGGDISIESPQFTVLNQGQIIAQADAGQGGNINIKSKQFITSPDSLISASSNLGLDGNVKIDSPEIDMEGFLVVLPGGFIENVELAKPCRVQDVGELNTFKKRISREGMPMAPFGFQE